MADFRDVLAAMQAADDEASTWFKDATLSTNDPGICGMLEAIRLEIRAAAIRADYNAPKLRHG